MDITNKQSADDVPGAPGLGLRRPPFGLSREKMNRVEVTLAIRGGGVVTVFEALEEEATAERVETLANELAEQIQAGGQRRFIDAPSATGQRSWVNLAEVVAFSVRQAK